MPSLDWLYYLLLLVCSIIGLMANVLGLPGLWLMVGAMGGYAWLTGFDRYVGWPSLIALVVLAGIAELVEFAAGAAGSKAAGGRARGAMGAVAGGLLGGLFLTFLVPIPVVGTIVGACAGAFLGATVMEFFDRDIHHAVRVGMGAAKGRFIGILSKLAFGAAMLVVIVVAAIPVGGPTAPPLPQAATGPATGP